MAFWSDASQFWGRFGSNSLVVRLVRMVLCTSADLVWGLRFRAVDAFGWMEDGNGAFVLWKEVAKLMH